MQVASHCNLTRPGYSNPNPFTLNFKFTCYWSGSRIHYTGSWSQDRRYRILERGPKMILDGAWRYWGTWGITEGAETRSLSSALVRILGLMALSTLWENPSRRKWRSRCVIILRISFYWDSDLSVRFQDTMQGIIIALPVRLVGMGILLNLLYVTRPPFAKSLFPVPDSPDPMSSTPSPGCLKPG
jgi:hypothetical protein